METISLEQEVNRLGDPLVRELPGWRPTFPTGPSIDLPAREYDLPIRDPRQNPNPVINPHGYGPTMYCGGAQIKPTSTGFVLPLPVPSGLPLRDLHETFKIDRYNNTYNNHTTITHNNNQKNRLYW